MSLSDTPTLIVVTGPPAAGKTTIAAAIAARLGLPLIAKDGIKETLHGELAGEGRAWSRRLGIATFDVLFHVLAQLLDAGVSVVAEGNFGRAGPFLALPRARVVQVHVRAEPELLRDRMLARAGRHPVHYDIEAAAEVCAAAAAGEWEPLPLGGVLLSLDTTAAFPDARAVAERVAEAGT